MQPNKVESILATGENFDYVLFKTAIFFAENGLHVWFISPETFEKAPKDIKPPDKEVLQLITFMYLKDYNDLVTQLNGIHMWRKTPSVIIVSRFDVYCKFFSAQYNPLQAALVATCLLDSAAVCARRHSDNIKLIVTCGEPNEGNLKKLQVFNDLYFSKYVHKSDDEEFFTHVIQELKT